MVLNSSFGRIAGATAVVILTIADEAVWLVPYTSPSLPNYTRVVNGAIFVLTLEFLASICVIVATGVQWAIVTDTTDSEEQSNRKKTPNIIWLSDETLLALIGAGVCWIIAGILFVRKWLKRRKRASMQTALHRAETDQADNDYGSLMEQVHNEGNSRMSSDKGENDDVKDIPNVPSPWAVFSFTVLGAIDEVSYFPSLILGKMFTPTDLCVGTLIAAGIIFMVVTAFQSHCKPIVKFLERIPLYGIVSVFAVVLTLGVAADIISEA